MPTCKGCGVNWIDRKPFTFLILYVLFLHILLISGVVLSNILL